MNALTDKAVAREQSVGLIRKWVVFCLGTGFLWLMYPELFARFNLTILLDFAGIYLIYTFYVIFLARGFMFNLIWHFLYLVELFFLSLIIFYSGGMDSVLILFYPVILIGNALLRNSFKDFIYAGIISHFSYAFTLLAYYSSFRFYLDQYFWAQCLILGVIFVLGLMVLRYLHLQEHQIGELNGVIAAKEQRIEHVAIIEDRTGLYMSSYLETRLHEEVARALRYGANLCLLLLDVEYFHGYNDSQGQPAGNAAIQQLAKIMLRLTRDSDICCRIQACKMAIILPHTDLTGGIRLGERIRKEVEGLKIKEDEQIDGGMLAVAIGVGCLPVNARNQGDLVMVTETALQMAREAKSAKTRRHLSLIVASKEQASG